MAKQNAQPTDETRYCARCGISFLWSIEDQHQMSTLDLALTQRCPGCRQLLPAMARERGLVKWYNRQKGYGFITRYNQPDLYVHRTSVHQGRLVPDDLVEFALGANQQGPAAQDVIVVEAV